MDIRRIDLSPRSLERPLWWWIPHRAQRALVTIVFLIPIIAIAILLLPGSQPGRVGSTRPSRATVLTPFETALSDQIRHATADPTTTTTVAAPPPAPAPAPVQTPAVTAPPPTTPPAPQPDVDSSSAAAWAASPGVACIREHESGDDYSADTGNGYYGAYQDQLSTWEAAGGTGLPSDAPPAVQDQVNYQIWQSGGWGQWGTASLCGL